MNPLDKEASPVLGNPFFHRGPIRDRCYFYGRTRETRQALHMLRNGQCVSIVGPRRIGKTSHLFHLCDEVVQKEYRLGEEYVFAYVDCQGLGDLDKSRFCQWIWEAVGGALSEQLRVGNWASRVSDSGELREALVTIQEKGYRPVFLFDEFEYLATSQYMDQALFSLLRSLSQELGVSYVTASQMPVEDLTYYDDSALHSPFFSNFQVVHLGFLDPGEAEQMIVGLTRGKKQERRFSEEDLNFVFDIAGYHPFFLQLACYYLFEQKLDRRRSAMGNYETAHRQYAEDAERFFRYAWDHLEKDEQESVRLMCGGQVTRLDDGQTRRLERKCILYDNAVFSSGFAEFVCRQAEVGEAVREPPEPRACRLSISCGKHGWVGVRVLGSFSYEAESPRIMESGLTERLSRRTADALLLQDWRFQVKEIGRDLFEELILNRPEIVRGYQRAVLSAEQGALSLALHAPRHFLRLPFEALHSEDEGYLCLKFTMYRVISRRFFDKEPLSTSLISQLNSQGRRPRALVVASNTWGDPGPPISGVEEEARKVSTSLRMHGFDVCLLSTDDATEERVRSELARGDYLIFHYAGHGSHNPDSPEGNALHFWEGEQGQSEIRKLTASQLEGLVRDTPLRFVYLSSCRGASTAPPATLLDEDFLGVMDGLVMGGVPAMLGFRWPVGDSGAHILAQSFYSAWLEGGNRLDQALCEARRTVADRCGRDERAWFSPILVMRTPNF